MAVNHSGLAIGATASNRINAATTGKKYFVFMGGEPCELNASAIVGDPSYIFEEFRHISDHLATSTRLTEPERVAGLSAFRSMH
jgi:hypothetical protein